MEILKNKDTAKGANGKDLFRRGDLSETPVAGLLLDALEERLTGTLTLTQGAVRKVIHLHQGCPVYARASLRRETPGLILEEEMTENVRQRIETCLIWRGGSWMFIGDEELNPSGPICPLDTLDVVFGGFKRYSSPREPLVKLAGRERDTLKLLPRCVKYREQFVVAFGASLLEAAAAGISIGALITTSGLQPGRGALQVSVLLLTGMAGIRGDDHPFDDEPTPIVDVPEVNNGSFFADDPTPVVDPAEVEPGFGDEPTPVVDADDDLFDDEPTPIVDVSQLNAAPAEDDEVTGPVVEPAPTETARARRHEPVSSRVLPWLTFVLGVVSAWAFFMVYPPDGPGPALVYVPQQTTPPASPAVVASRGKEARPARKAQAADAGAVARAAEVAPARDGGQAAPPSRKPPAIASGLAVAAIIRPCLTTGQTRTYLISVKMSARGRVNLAFVARLPGTSPAVLRCIKRKLKGATLPLRLRKDGFMEWRIRFKTDPPSVVVRPKFLRNVVQAEM